jgi:hypothetical protein
VKRVTNERVPTPYGIAYRMLRVVDGERVCIVEIVPETEVESSRRAAAMRVLAARRKLREAVERRALSTSNRPVGAP